MTKKIALLPILGSLMLFGVGCISFSSDGTSPNSDGGIFKSANRGDDWTQKVAVPATGGEQKTISGVNIATIVQDPQDPNAVYIGTTESGLFYSYDGGDSWQRPTQISTGRVASIAVHPKDKCTVYATSGNRLLKTEDCSRTWNVTYFDTRTDRQTTAVLVDFFNPDNVWVSTDGGDVLVSTDAGRSWVNSTTLKSAVREMLMVTSDSRRVYVATKSNGIYRTDDAGANWKELSKGYTDFSGAIEFSDMSIGVSDPAVIVMASRYGLIRSRDYGDTWESIDLLTPPRSTNIYSVALDSKDVNGIYYGTSTTFYRSPNGGVNWIPTKLPTSRTATVLLVDSVNSNVLYMGVTKIK
ncbi:MAG: YCF48-related protein [Patescibacteria group bacterium]